MSKVRRVRPKKTIPKPKPIKIGSQVNTRKTVMTNMNQFQNAVSRIKSIRLSSGTLKADSKETVEVDFKISQSLGFRKTKEGQLEIITVAPLSRDEQKLLQNLTARYHLEVAKEALEREGFSIEEIGEADRTIIRATSTHEDVRRTIEVTAEHPLASVASDIEEDVVIRIHAKDFENEQECNEAAAIVSEVINGEVISDVMTGEYSSIPSREKSSNAQRKVISSQDRELRKSKGDRR